LELFRHVAGVPVATKMAGLTKKYLLRSIAAALPAVLQEKGLKCLIHNGFDLLARLVGDI
jgi:hypothetical protein